MMPNRVDDRAGRDRVVAAHHRRDGASPHAIDAAITAEPTQGQVFSDRSELHAALREFERDETKRLRKETQLPLDAPTPKTICWMEVR